MTTASETSGDYRCASPLAQAAFDHAAALMKADTTGHDYQHLLRVMRLAARIAEGEGVDVATVEIIAALHDIEDFKFTGDEYSGAAAAESWLLDHHASPEFAAAIAADIAAISFKGADVAEAPLSRAGRCVWDADKLDAIGAVGIARCYAWGGSRGRPIHDPAVPVKRAASVAEYLDHVGTSRNHFDEKLLLLVDRFRTATGRKLARQRHEFMVQYLRQFDAECLGQA